MSSELGDTGLSIAVNPLTVLGLVTIAGIDLLLLKEFEDEVRLGIKGKDRERLAGGAGKSLRRSVETSRINM